MRAYNKLPLISPDAYAGVRRDCKQSGLYLRRVITGAKKASKEAITMLIKTCFAFYDFNISITKITSYYRIHLIKSEWGWGE